MYIKSISITGFKSYTQPVILRNLTSFTAITGLNGSGKSNILDAILFALTFDANLRCKKITDLINNSYSEAIVILEFDNTDKKHSPLNFESYDIISVQRVLDKNGKSKMHLNGSQCSFKTIRKMFSSVHLFPNCFSIVLQGSVTKVLDKSVYNLVLETSGLKHFENEKKNAFNLILKKEQKLLAAKNSLKKIVEPFFSKLRNERMAYMEYKRYKENLERNKHKISIIEYFLLKNLTIKNCKELLLNVKEYHLTHKDIDKINEYLEIPMDDLNIFDVKKEIEKKVNALDVAMSKLSNLINEKKTFEENHKSAIRMLFDYEKKLGLKNNSIDSLHSQITRDANFCLENTKKNDSVEILFALIKNCTEKFKTPNKSQKIFDFLDTISKRIHLSTTDDSNTNTIKTEINSNIKSGLDFNFSYELNAHDGFLKEIFNILNIGKVIETIVILKQREKILSDDLKIKNKKLIGINQDISTQKLSSIDDVRLKKNIIEIEIKNIENAIKSNNEVFENVKIFFVESNLNFITIFNDLLATEFFEKIEKETINVNCILGQGESDHDINIFNKELRERIENKLNSELETLECLNRSNKLDYLSFFKLYKIYFPLGKNIFSSLKTIISRVETSFVKCSSYLNQLDYPFKKGIFGKISDNYSIKNKKFTNAINVIFGSKNNYLIVANENIASNILNTTRTNIIPLNRIRSSYNENISNKIFLECMSFSSQFSKNKKNGVYNCLSSGKKLEERIDIDKNITKNSNNEYFNKKSSECIGTQHIVGNHKSLQKPNPKANFGDNNVFDIGNNDCINGVNCLSLIEYPIETKSAFEFICGNYYVFEDKDLARRICYKYNVFCVTIDGNFYDPRGIITGGKTFFKAVQSKKKDFDKEMHKLNQYFGALILILDLIFSKILFIDQLNESKKDFSTKKNQYNFSTFFFENFYNVFQKTKKVYADEIFDIVNNDDFLDIIVNLKHSIESFISSMDNVYQISTKYVFQNEEYKKITEELEFLESNLTEVNQEKSYKKICDDISIREKCLNKRLEAVKVIYESVYQTNIIQKEYLNAKKEIDNIKEDLEALNADLKSKELEKGKKQILENERVGFEKRKEVLLQHHIKLRNKVNKLLSLIKSELAKLKACQRFTIQEVENIIQNICTSGFSLSSKPTNYLRFEEGLRKKSKKSLNEVGNNDIYSTSDNSKAKININNSFDETEHLLHRDTILDDQYGCIRNNKYQLNPDCTFALSVEEVGEDFFYPDQTILCDLDPPSRNYIIELAKESYYPSKIESELKIYLLELNKSIQPKEKPNMDPKNFALLERNEETIKQIENKITKLEADKIKIIKGINKWNERGKKEFNKALDFLNKECGNFLRCFIKDGDIQVVAKNNNYVKTHIDNAIKSHFTKEKNNTRHSESLNNFFDQKENGLSKKCENKYEAFEKNKLQIRNHNLDEENPKKYSSYIENVENREDSMIFKEKSNDSDSQNKLNQDRNTDFSPENISLHSIFESLETTLEDSYEIRVKVGDWKNNIKELSGGQRSIIALSLILTMLKYNPAPFYLFDEVDSALDEHFTSAIGSVFKLFNAQFIIVSLKDGLYSSATSVYQVLSEKEKTTIARIR
ncbi:hypothetical protein EDEG_00209 [Edhazardia aedis USNM 41457]|uniref:SMC hinge domain-containing protein n=1 Tax=Edhazardia aedis (strain USNM 41457) TaxID=1003232 RepID=J9DL26_EDHAE|nr:hypothetical protein EDEG_00209 [Edhazardia aedis USNM 41457]|eukprot:EJW03300.1 hypothetical protein EDEG_00209 [Edhazardia aedis USNM 41457]